MSFCQAINPPDGLRCQVCLDTFSTPVQLFGCTHIFCENCVRGASKCPICRSVIDYVKPAPVSVAQASMSILVNCRSCGWRGTRADSQIHRCGVTDTHTIYNQYPRLSDEEMYRRATTKGPGGIFEGPSPGNGAPLYSTGLPPTYANGDGSVNGIVFGFDHRRSSRK